MAELTPAAQVSRKVCLLEHHADKTFSLLVPLTRHWLGEVNGGSPIRIVQPAWALSDGRSLPPSAVLFMPEDVTDENMLKAAAAIKADHPEVDTVFGLLVTAEDRRRLYDGRLRGKAPVAVVFEPTSAETWRLLRELLMVLADSPEEVDAALKRSGSNLSLADQFRKPD